MRVCGLLCTLLPLLAHAAVGQPPAELHAVGPTGAGKSHFLKLVAERLGAAPADIPFVPGAGTESETQAPVHFQVQNVSLNDYPGQLDSGGVAADEKNLRKIVDHAKARGSISGLTVARKRTGRCVGFACLRVA